MRRVVVIGGGYAGLACLIELSRKGKDLELHLVDSDQEHCKITNLHKTLAKPLAEFTVPFAELAKRYSLHFHQHRVDLSPEDLVRLQSEKTLSLPDREISFDWLVVCTGASPVAMPEGENTVTQEDLRSGRAVEMFNTLLKRAEEQDVQVSLVGGGATGLQVLFEVQALLNRKSVAHKLRLIDLNPRLVPELPEGVHRYVLKKLEREGIDYLPATRYLGQQDEQVDLAAAEGDRRFSLPSHLTLLFPGVVPDLPLQTDPHGRVTVGDQLLSEVFSGGDCAQFASAGLNTMTAQAAVRKGKLVAHNLINLCREKSLRTYSYREKGYLLSLGPDEAVGWLGLRCNLAKGFGALVVKEALETQYDLYLRGVDTYLGSP